ncbi:MAG: PEGA domain-containing protein [Acidobacteriia bacterium]|nr:PEGA domain-containing protein [Terriglobia bacterium]
MRILANDHTAHCKSMQAACAIAVVLFIGILVVIPEPLFADHGFGWGVSFGHGFPQHRVFNGFGFHHNFYPHSFGFFPSFSFFYSGFGPYYDYPGYWGPRYWAPGSPYPPGYTLDEQAPRQQDSRDKNIAWLKLDILPAEASVYIDGKYAGKGSEFANGKKLLPVSPDSHTLRVEADGFQSAVVDLKVNPLQTLDVTEHLQTGAAATTSPRSPAPPTPSVSPSRSTARTPPPMREPYSAPPIRRGNAGQKASTDARIDTHPSLAPQHETSPSNPSPAKAEDVQFGRITVRIEQPTADAAIYVDGKFMGVSDLSNPDFVINDVPPGKHTVSVTKPGYAHFKEDIIVSPSQNKSVKAVLRKG